MKQIFVLDKRTRLFVITFISKSLVKIVHWNFFLINLIRLKAQKQLKINFCCGNDDDNEENIEGCQRLNDAKDFFYNETKQIRN
jgi:hypothetical protein